MRWIATFGMSLVGAMFLSVRAWADVDEIEPVAGMRITASARIVPGTYRLADPEDDGALLISGDDITVGFAGAAIIGAREGTDPDRFTGRGIVVRGKNVTLKNVKLWGYKIGIYAENSPGIRITGCDVSRNYRQRLKSTITHEDLSDWLYGYENDNNAWMRYCAGIYLLNCPGATVANCRARNGQNGLCICRCDGTYVVDNDMSFMSGWMSIPKMSSGFRDPENALIIGAFLLANGCDLLSRSAGSFRDRTIQVQFGRSSTPPGGRSSGSASCAVIGTFWRPIGLMSSLRGSRVLQ